MSIYDDLSRARAFVAIIETGSISAAAKRLNLSQPTLSRHLKILEQKCGVSLLYRDTHRIQLTAAGTRFLEDTREILSMVNESEERFSEGNNQLTGHLRVFATIDIGQRMVSQIIAGFLQQNTQVTAELAYFNRPLHMLEEGCDLGIVVGHLSDDRVITQRIGTQELALCASPALLESRIGLMQHAQNTQHKHRESVQDSLLQAGLALPSALQDWPWLSVSGKQFNRCEAEFKTPGESPIRFEFDPVFQAEGVTCLREMALLGTGLAMLPTWLVRDDLASGELVNLMPVWRPTGLPVNIVHPQQKFVPTRLKSFINYASQHMKLMLNPRILL